MFLVISCNQDDMPEEMTNTETEIEEMTQIFDLSFSSDGSTESSVSFIVLSDNNGEVLFDTAGAELDIEISLHLDSSTVVNATTGFVKAEKFSIVSYSEVKSGSQLNLSREWETHPCFRSGPVDGSNAKLYITDLNDFYETINSIVGSDSGSLELKGDTLVLEGHVPSWSDGSYQIAIREQENSELMSIVIPRMDWNWDNDSQSMSHTVSFHDFSSTKEHVIDLDRTDRWNLAAKVCDLEGNLIALQSPVSNSKLEDGQNASIYLNEAIEINDLKLYLSNNNYPSSYAHNWIHKSIPDKINLEVDVNPTFNILEVDKFAIFNTFDYNLNVLNYLYVGDYDWTIISKGGSNVRFVKPELPSQLHETFTYLNDLLQNPYGVTNTMYRTEEELDDITTVHKSVIPRNKNNTPDFNYSSKESSLDL